MKQFVAAALLVSASSAMAASGQFASLVSYEYVFSKPSTATGTTSGVLNTSIEYTFPRSLSLYGGATFILRDSYESSLNFGARLYTSTPLFHWGQNKPIWSYVGVGTYLVDNLAYFPEAGLRIATSDNTRMDVFFKVYNSSDTAYDRLATLGVGLTF
ncbi:hypothetical protein [Marinomonas mediterranea]|jgi:hypothetical protein|uniref:Outer membrane protein beta-barrel domain-containing protein n=1 Tax=Marinomonas mediterranea (strain ATCC 700492 / JCM 21426 / NBRC 103028 / MMB-1) TaxID=717774 RepID=F2K1U7_MARM1|nr:hypothetical protein [Marinomonas mediterranea]ADZ89941.1 hypothetical protein Marme_0657 [Marinomonas mediterranea MMB-1]WCN08019.1 hypothetical protein GV055_03345 [Marinomonas mediterranea]WCN12114.1 hypothetical protein GV054_03360 [Marinomonas mediterranea]WCN16151.1 hypothetical protein GV053_03290 [Marinomonas mediterranea MMB-1]